MNLTFEDCARELVATGRQLYEQGMVPATSGNFSARLGAERFAITESGKHKGRLQVEDIMQVDQDGRSLDGRRPSAETALHMQIYRQVPGAGVILHHHSAYATLLSQIAGAEVVLSGYEVLKAFPGISSHSASLSVPVFENSQDMADLSNDVQTYMAEHDPFHGYLIRGHGLYTWADNFNNVLNNVEAFEFLFRCEIMKRGVTPI